MMPAPDGGVDASAASGPPGTRGRLLGPLLASVAMLVVGVVGSSRPAWSGDEAATVVILRRSGEQFWAAVRNDPAIAPYYVLVKPWSAVSMGHLWLRLPSAVAMAAAAGLVYVLIRRVLGPSAAIACVAAMVVLPATSRYGQDARPYALAVLGTTAAVLLWCRYMETGQKRWAVGLWAALVFAGLMHAYALLIVVALLVTAVTAPVSDRRTEVTRTSIVAALAGATLTPWLLTLSSGAQGQPDPPAVTVRNVAEEVARLPSGVLYPPPAVAGFAAVSLGLCAAGFAWFLARRTGRHRSLAVVAVAWLIVAPAVLIIVQAVTGKPGLVGRYWVFGLPGLAIGIGLGLAAGRRPRTVGLGIGALLVLAVPIQSAIRTENGHLGERWVRLPEVLEQPAFDEIPLLIRGFQQRGLSANAPDLPPARTPLNGDPGPRGRISPVPRGPGSRQFSDLTENHDTVFIYQQRRGGTTSVPRADDFTEAADATAVFSQPIALCQYYGDALGLFAKPQPHTNIDHARRAAAAIESVQPAQIDCQPAPD